MSDARIDSIIASVLRDGAAMTPTLVVVDRMSRAPDLLADPAESDPAAPAAVVRARHLGHGPRDESRPRDGGGRLRHGARRHRAHAAGGAAHPRGWRASAGGDRHARAAYRAGGQPAAGARAVRPRPDCRPRRRSRSGSAGPTPSAWPVWAPCGPAHPPTSSSTATTRPGTSPPSSRSLAVVSDGRVYTREMLDAQQAPLPGVLRRHVPAAGSPLRWSGRSCAWR